MYTHLTTPQRIGVLAVMVLVLSITGLTAPGLAEGEENWWEPAAQETQDELSTLQSTLSQTLEHLDQASEGLDQFETWVTNNLSGRERQQVLAQIHNTQEALEAHSAPLRIANNRLAQVTSVVDGIMELQELADAAGQRRGGNLAGAMHVIGTLMEDYGAEIPGVGDVVTFYGAAIGNILDATDQIAQTLETNRNQGMFGAGTYLGTDNPLYQALESQFGSDFASQHIFEPAGYPYLYQEIDNDQRTFTLIWDPASQTWTRVSRSPGDMQRLYRSYALAQGHPSPQILTTLANTSFDAAMNRLDAGRAAFDLWTSLNTVYGNVAFDQVNRANDYSLSALLDDPELFAARFTHDQSFNRQIQDWMTAMYKAALEAEAAGLDDGSTAAAIRAWAEKYGIPLPGVTAEEESNATETPQAQPGGGQPSAVASSIVLLIDASGSMGDDGKMDAAKAAAHNVLSQVGDGTEVALIVFYDCGDIRVEQDFTGDVDAVLAKVDGISPSGSTPLAAAITFARQYITQNASGSPRLVVLSDGEETCGGDPVAAARQ